MSNQPPARTPRSDAHRVLFPLSYRSLRHWFHSRFRLKRLAKPQARVPPPPASPAAPSAGPSTSISAPKPVSITIKRSLAPAPAPSPSPATPQKRRPLEFNLAKWEPEVVENVFHTSLDVRPSCLPMPIARAEAAPARTQCEEWQGVA